MDALEELDGLGGDGDVGFARGDLPGVLDGEAGAVERDRAGAGGAAERAGIMSNGIAYTLQIVGQCGMNETVASLIMSLESAIAVIAGWLLLGEVLSQRELFGCVLMAGAVVLAQLPAPKSRRSGKD